MSWAEASESDSVSAGYACAGEAYYWVIETAVSTAMDSSEAYGVLS